jgi:hypothetical protein
MGVCGNEYSNINKARALNQVLCKIKINNSFKGNGFLCKIPFPDKFHLLPVLITNKILNKNDMKKCFEIIYLGKHEEEKKLVYYDERKIFISQEYDIVFIEIFPHEDSVNTFLELDEENDEIGKGRQVNIYQYNNQKEIKLFKGEIKKINKEFEIKHSCSIKGNILGFPIFSLNNKVIGIIKNKDNYKYGNLLKKPIEKFQEELINKITEQAMNCLCEVKLNNNNFMNGFICKIH